MKFEEKLKRLEDIVQQMENPKKELEELIGLFKEGIALTQDCRAELSGMDKEVKIVMEEAERQPLKNLEDYDEELPF
jgi:exodeoxyribonuclease VII small subunit